LKPRVVKHVAHIEDLITKLKKHVQMKLVGEIDVGDVEEMDAVLSEEDGGDLTLAKIADRVEKTHEAEPIDREWLKHATGLIAKLGELKWCYQNGAC
jgi:pyruvate-ferredoxin/flavodoxin oxidoreductase